jgi:CBS domain-containing protein
MDADGFSKIRLYRDQHIQAAAIDHFSLNHFHDDLINQTLELAMKQTIERYGPPPCLFSFFVMGSAGRFEQAVWSDQDHGIIYQEQNDEAKSYFLALGKAISNGLYLAGYDYCDGGVMASNPFWCKSVLEWQNQLANWLHTSSWESIRHLLIFMDGRSVYGESQFIDKLKSFVYQSIDQANLLRKIFSNTMYVRKSIGVFGQILTETHGRHTGAVNLKEIAFFPYVNAIRLLAIKGRISKTSTLSRLDAIPNDWLPSEEKQMIQRHFLQLLKYRLSLVEHPNYEFGHYLLIKLLTKEQKNELKEILKHGATLYRFVRHLVEKEEE